MQGDIINRVTNSSLIEINLEDYYDTHERVVYDIKDNLFQGFVLKEKEFRAFVKANDWSQYQEKNVAIICSSDAIVPTWAYMLLVTSIEPYANTVLYGSLENLEQYLFQQALSKFDLKEMQDAKVMIKGCGRYPVPEFAYVEITRLLKPIVTSLMYGEACSAVPVYKKARK
jgi:dihydroneopterin aldolase